MNPDLIFLPMILMAFATIGLYYLMSKIRLKGIATGKVDPKVYKLNEGEPEESRLYSNAISNQFETPVLFYVVCISAYVTGMAGWLMISLAFLYTAAKLAHIWFHTQGNKLSHRRPTFIASFLVLILMWLVFAIQLVIY